ncbi:hypothetical protein LAZ67_22000618 [Cordylochernes scorpioides]|uniref:Transposase n=1 Tax=Cordylochernes scorpioides TaxID=51811 RepID=A0ABY6LQQ8_9ARAC|nr:hypothetical protein LAZ67_22000618 [Cordylochernes scorpioides]
MEKKRKIDSECRKFKDQWNIQYFVIESSNKALCLICNESIARFFELRAVIEIFLNEKHRPLTELQNNAWLWKLAFYVDLTKHVNELNLRLQGENQHLPDLDTNIKSFRMKLILFQSQLRSKCFSHFKTCEIFSHTTETEFPIDFAIETLSALKINFDTRFSDFDAIANQIKIFQNPFDADIETLAPELQMEMIDLQCSDIIKNKYENSSLLEFYKSLPLTQFDNLHKFARGLFSVFGTTNLCEKTFSKMKYTKNVYRSKLTDEHLKSLLIIGTSKISPQLQTIKNSKRGKFLEPVENGDFRAKKCPFAGILLFAFNWKKSATEAHRMLEEVHGDHALSKSQCYRWFKKFQSGDFELDNEPRGKPHQKFEDAELQALHEKKSFLHRIVTSDEESNHFSNPMRQKSWGLPGQFSKQTPRPNRFGKKAMLCVWWDWTGVVYFELLKPGETVNTSRYKQQMHSLKEALNEKRPEWREKLILQHDKAPAHNATVVKNTIKYLGWELLPHPLYSPDLAQSNYHFSHIQDTP